MAKSLSEELKDLKIQALLEDYVNLEEKIKEIPDILSEHLQEVRKAIKDMPSELEVGIEKLAAAVEEAESSYKYIAEKHRAVLNNQLDEAKLELRQHISAAISDNINDINSKLNQLSNKVENIKGNSTFISQKSLIAMILMSGITFLSLIVCIVQIMTRI
ncbi:hypothetical protein [Klebsiella pneumoniae]|uniref:hypothetical protein n=1 Tax=Klebsiella pneumoniae TaxID=573 RepID=UPI002DBD1A1A|nr:hypothetical protein [Klebsiella pneumoniae]MEC4506228.1 hypothetical protein [Klebsiella pneumoniae]HDO7064252.1 hypothetical protein [Klebsiella pneumoniae]